MALSEATAGYGCLLKRGDGGVGAGVAASRTMGSSNSQLIISWGEAGTAGNSKTCSVVVSGNNTPLSVTVSQSNVTVNCETDGSGVSVSTVNDVIAKLYQDATFQAYWDATDGAGDGTGVLAAASSASLSGGSAGTEAFTAIAEVKGFSGPNETAELIDVTHLQSDNARREYLSSLLDSGEISFDINFLPANANQAGLRSDLNARTRRNFQIVFSDTAATTWQFAAFVTAHSVNAQIGDILSGSVTLKITGAITEV